MNPENPLVSFILLSYNQEPYIREAVAGALAQTYSPLEIILSDDGSRDRTFEIMREMTASYTGPHRIILNQNITNLGLASHFNKVFDLSSGQIIVAAAGDDVSKPDRVISIAETFSKSPSDTMLVYSDALETDEAGGPLRQIGRSFNSHFPYSLSELIRKPQYIVGATMAWRRELMNFYGKIQEDTTNEDVALLYRSILMGRVEYIDKPLVNWRRIRNSLSDYQDNTLRSRIRSYTWLCSIFRQLKVDLKTHSTEHIAHISLVDLQLARYEVLLQQWTQPGNLLTAVMNSLKLRHPAILSEYLRSKTHER